MGFEERIILVYRNLADANNRIGELKTIMKDNNISCSNSDIRELRDFIKINDHCGVHDLAAGAVQLELKQKGIDYLSAYPERVRNRRRRLEIEEMQHHGLKSQMENLEKKAHELSDFHTSSTKKNKWYFIFSLLSLILSILAVWISLVT